MLLIPLQIRAKKRALLLAAVLSITCITPSFVVADEYKEVSALGRWKLTKAIDSADITSLDDREARQLIGRVFTINEEHVRFGKRDCGAPELTAESVEPSWFMREYVRASSIDLHLSNPVTVVHLACTFAFIKNPDHMIMHWKGWFFDAKRVR